jgi:hypothetical protein
VVEADESTGATTGAFVSGIRWWLKLRRARSLGVSAKVNTEEVASPSRVVLLFWRSEGVWASPGNAEESRGGWDWLGMSVCRWRWPPPPRTAGAVRLGTAVAEVAEVAEVAAASGKDAGCWNGTVLKQLGPYSYASAKRLLSGAAATTVTPGAEVRKVVVI